MSGIVDAGLDGSFRASDDVRDLCDGKVLKEMQDKHLTVFDTQLAQRMVNSLPIFIRKRWLYSFVEIFELCFLGLLAGVATAD
ncbi:MAG TPA: hypothetical protein VHZ28_04770, partial [Terracidiphilus sp.]|nr:hypothetical protein [Terracidiphilus sp.]